MTTSNPNIYVRQWDVGSFTDPNKKPYKVSERYNGTWECSCPAWTRHTPRTDCKHIIKVRKAILFAPDSPVFIAPPPAANKTQPNVSTIMPSQPTRMIIDGYTIRRRALDDTLTDATETFGDDRTTSRRSRREI